MSAPSRGQLLNKMNPETIKLGNQLLAYLTAQGVDTYGLTCIENHSVTMVAIDPETLTEAGLTAFILNHMSSDVNAPEPIIIERLGINRYMIHSGINEAADFLLRNQPVPAWVLEAPAVTNPQP